MTTRIAATDERGTTPRAAIDSHDESGPSDRMAVATVDRGSHRRSGGMLVAVALVVAVAVIVLVSSIAAGHPVDERRRLEVADVVGRYDVALTGHKWVSLEPLLAPALVFHNVEYGSRQDRAAFLAWATTIGNSYRDFAISIDDVQLDGEVVTVRFHEDGKDAHGVPTSGAADLPGVVRMRVVARQIVEMWSNYDEFGLLRNRALAAAG
jgi:hypothetical protein